MRDYGGRCDVPSCRGMNHEPGCRAGDRVHDNSWGSDARRCGPTLDGTRDARDDHDAVSDSGFARFDSSSRRQRPRH